MIDKVATICIFCAKIKFCGMKVRNLAGPSRQDVIYTQGELCPREIKQNTVDDNCDETKSGGNLLIARDSVT